MTTITIQIPEATHKKFKVICALLGIKMRRFIEGKIDELIAENQSELVGKFNGN